MPTSSKIEQIFDTLESAGYPRALQEHLLPEWVTSEVLNNNNTSKEIAVILAQRLGLKTSGLFAEHTSIESLRTHKPKYKRSIPAKSKNLSPITAIAVTVAEMVSFACTQPYIPLEQDTIKLRNSILETHKGKWIGLRNVLLTCWAHGIPVIHLSNLGNMVSKMDAMVVFANGRPNIVMSKNSRSWAWQLFILTHELGHCALGHVSPDEILIDEQLGSESYALSDPDNEEQAADKFAISLLNGRDDATYTASIKNINAQELSKVALDYGTAHKIDPGHIVLNYGNHNNQWQIANAAINYLERNTQPANQLINELLWHQIDLSSLPEDSIDFINRFTITESVA